MFIFAAITTKNNYLLQSSTVTIKKANEQTEVLNVPIPLVLSSSTAAATENKCQEPCSIDYCYKHKLIHENCTRLIRDQCNCCTVCLRTENQICGGYLNVYGLCEQDLLCYKSNNTRHNLPEQTGICVRACLKLQCLPVNIDNKVTCECANRRLPCDEKLHHNTNDNNMARYYCEQYLLSQQERELSPLKANDVNNVIDCSNIVCNITSINSSICPSDSHFVDNDISLLRASLLRSKSRSSLCCRPRGQCVCSTCPKTLCGENAIIQIHRTGNPNIPGQCCNQFECLENSKQCYQDKKVYNENETWFADQCTTCICRDGLPHCTVVQCPVYEHCGYMYKSEDECCPKCGGCLNDQYHVQLMNSTWLESNGCMRCWCDNGQSRCIAEGCIAPPCENPRQIDNVCCPVCDDPGDKDQYSQTFDKIPPSWLPLTTSKCPLLNSCSLVCEHGLAKDEHGCLQCACSIMSCPLPLCTLKFNVSLSKEYCSCQSPDSHNCEQLDCYKHCPYNYLIDNKTSCLTCQCNPCPRLICTKNCTYGLKRNEIGCLICVCEGSSIINNSVKYTDLIPSSWPRRCDSGLVSYSNGEIWFDGCRQCLCHKGKELCALISCPVPKCLQPIHLPNRCCPTCPEEIPMLPEPIPSSQVCYISQYVTGEELEFDNCTTCICLNNIAYCSISLCPPLRCSSPINDRLYCCPICPTNKTETLPTNQISNVEEDVCKLENGMTKRAGELWKHDDCRSCLCSRGSGGKIECFSQKCGQNLPCSNPILKKGQCCPFCLPPTTPITVCIFNDIKYRSGEHWNISECYHCECSYDKIICHQRKCPSLTCVHTVTLSGHCCPICYDQLPFINDRNRLILSHSRFGLTIIVIFSILIFILIMVIISLILILLCGRHRSSLSSNQLATIHYRPALVNTKTPNMFAYVKYDLIAMSNDTHNNNDNNNARQELLSRNIPLSSFEQASTYSIIETNTTTIGASSSNNELEASTCTENDAILQCSACSSNDDDDDDDEGEHRIFNSDHDESHHQRLSNPQICMVPEPPTIIYI